MYLKAMPMPPKQPHNQTLYTLQLLRFMAAVLVMLFHLGVMPSGYKGVDVFFVISGFVMYYTTSIAKRSSAAVFAVNRLTKIYLLYWLVLIAFYAVQPYPFSRSLVATVLLIPRHVTILGVSWSLSYELYFYLLFGLMAYLLPVKAQVRVFILLLAASTVITCVNLTNASVQGSILNALLGQNLWQFLLGILAAYVFSRYRIRPRAAAVVAIAAVLVLVCYQVPYDWSIRFIIYGLLAFIMVATSTLWERYGRPLPRPVAAAIKTCGDASYAMYLTGPAFGIIMPTHNTPQKILVIAATAAASIAINKLIENPLLKRLRRGLLKGVRRRVEESL